MSERLTGQGRGRRAILVSGALALGALGLALTAGAVMWHGARDAAGARCDGKRFVVRHVPGGAAPYITLRAGGRTGAFLLDYGATASTVSAAVFGGAGGSVAVDDFTLPTFPTGRFATATYHTPHAPSGGQLGIVGTDFLSLLTADFSYGFFGSDVVLGEHPCPAETLTARGLVPVKQAGYFSRDSGRVLSGRNNVPVVHVDFGAAVVPAQIDTGYDDIAAAPSIDVNEALFQKLLAAGRVMRRGADMTVSTCSGHETREVYRLDGVRLQNELGAVITTLRDVHLTRKRPNGCGGIAAMSEPAAQVAASVLARIGTVVFDPRAETVWFARR